MEDGLIKRFTPLSEEIQLALVLSTALCCLGGPDKIFQWVFIFIFSHLRDSFKTF